MSIVRKDGKFTFYKIQACGENGRWYYVRFYPFLKTASKQTRAKFEKLEDKYNACGDCWQETGNDGTYDFQTACDMVMILCKENKGVSFRVVKITIEQETTQVMSLMMSDG